MDIHQSSLNMEDLRTYYRGKKSLEEYWRSFIIQEATEFLTPPCGHEACNAQGRKLNQSLPWIFIGDRSFDPLQQLKRHARFLGAWSFCDHTKASAIERCNDMREQLWEDLPSIFGLGSWEELRNDT